MPEFKKGDFIINAAFGWKGIFSHKQGQIVFGFYTEDIFDEDAGVEFSKGDQLRWLLTHTTLLRPGVRRWL